MAVDSSQWIPGRRLRTELGFTVYLIDGFTGKGGIIGEADIMLPGMNKKAYKNKSDYYNFFKLSAGTYSLQVNAGYYLNKTIEDITIPRNNTYTLSSPLTTGSVSARLSDIAGLRDGDVLEFINGEAPAERRIIWRDTDPGVPVVHWVKDPAGSLLYNYPVDSPVSIPFPFNYVVPVLLKPCYLYPYPGGTTLLRGTVTDAKGTPLINAVIETTGLHINTNTSINGDFALAFPIEQEDELITIMVTPEGLPVQTSESRVKRGKAVSVEIVYY
ncbi:MAG: hypothetical protein JXJ04_04810 [Spirochaetales bacterium]|nr:hypothetical protein [Spirochaetales bacterium]